MPDRNYIRSLERGIKVLEIFSDNNRGLTLTEVAEQSGLNKPSAKRFLHTFYLLGYLNRDEHKHYFLSAKVLTLGFGYLNSSDIRSVSKPLIDQLSNELNKTVNIAILADRQVLYLYRKEIVKYLKFELYDGSRLPVYCTSAGKVLLAGLSDEKLKREIERIDLEPITSKTISSKKGLWNEIIKTRNRGYATSDRELSMDLKSVAAPVFNIQGKGVAAVNVTFNAQDNNGTSLKFILDKLLEKCESISKRLGYQGIYPKKS